MGQVHRALDTRLGREVAVKVLPAHLARDPALLDRFEREARTLAALSHPNLVTLFDFGTQENVHYAVMELLEGETLRSRLDREPVDYSLALDIAEGVIDGLAAAHSRGIIHRDIKPENIFVTQENRIKILDFGLARMTPLLPPTQDTKAPTGPPVTQPGTIMGSVNYMSPEQVRGEDVDGRSDIFSFGCMLYEIITGNRPFQEQTAAETMVAILRQEPANLNQGKIPVDLERIICACLEKDPTMRFQSAHDLRLSIRSIRAGSGFVLQTPLPLTPKRKNKKIDSIAILPFTNAGTDPEMEYLSDGITESIINTLSQLPALRVMARSTVFRYKRSSVDPRTAGRELGVRAVLTGRLFQRDDQLNVQTELVNVADGSQLWGEQYTRPFRELLRIQEEIANAISERLQVKVAGSRKKRLSKRPTENEHAYQLYLQGRYHWNRRTSESVQKGVEYFNLAIQADPQFALAYAGLADSYSIMGGFGYLRPTEAYPRAKAAAEQALELDPDLAEAHTSLGMIFDRYIWDEEGAERHFQKAIKLNPGYATARQWYGVFLVMLHRLKEAEAEIQKALELDPLSVIIHWTKGYALLYMKRFPEAIRAINKALELDPTFGRARFDLAITYHIAGKSREAAQEFNDWLETCENTVHAQTLKAYALACLGRYEESYELLKKLEAQSATEYVSQFGLVVAYTELGKFDDAFAALERSVQAKEDALLSIRINPRLDRIRDDPRFKDIQRRINKM
jgi:serine/threonine-protein kinase